MSTCEREVAQIIEAGEIYHEGDGWPDPQPLPAGLPSVPPFEPELLPTGFRPWVLDIADRMQCPPDFPAVSATVAAAAVIGRQVAIRPKRLDDWTVIPNLFGAAIGRPGLLKSPAIDETLKPLRALEIEAAERHAEIEAEAHARALVAKAERQVAAAAVKKAVKSGDKVGALALITEAVEDISRPRRRYIVNDTTVEKLGEILNQNPRGVLVFRDELVGFLRTMDREGHEGDRAFYLEAWNGNGRHTYDRIGRGTIDIEGTCVSILGGIQPGPLAEYLAGAVRGGIGDDGLIQRFQLAVWPDPAASWRNVDRWPNVEAKVAAAAVFRRLDTIDPASIGAECGGEAVPFLRFDQNAQAAFNHWRSDLEYRLRAGDLHSALEAHLAKYRSLIPSLALVCHLVDDGAGPVSEAAMMRAAAWGEYLEGHARRLYASITHADADAARRLAERIKRGDLPDAFSSRNVWRPGWSGLSSRQAAQAAVDSLIDLNWLAAETRTTGGRSAKVYQVNPKVRALANALD